MTDFRLTDKQREAQALLGSGASDILLEGGSRSGKTFLLLRAIAARSIKAPGARAAVLRFRFNHLKASILADTWPKMLDLCFPGMRGRIISNKSDWYDEFPNGSQVWWGGLDEKERVEKVLGQEHATIYLNECSQIAYESKAVAETRLAQMVTQKHGPNAGQPLPLRMYYDANPPNKGHWLYRLFHQGVDPRTRGKVANPDAYARLLMNPRDNAANLPPEYIVRLEGLPKHMRDRFLDGIYADLNPNALFNADWLDRWRVIDGNLSLPKMQRVIVSVDPSGADEEHEGDEIGITVQGLGIDGNGYLLEDLTTDQGPATWGRVAATAYQRHRADCIVAERNYGGAMVKHVIKTAERDLGIHIAYREVSASRGKVVRAEPISALYEQGKVRHVGHFEQLEGELAGFSTTGYTGDESPNRADAAIWGWTELFPGLTRQIVEHMEDRRRDYDSDYSEYDELPLVV